MAHTTMTVRLNSRLADAVAANVGENGAYENVSEYVRDLIRRDMERMDLEAFERLKAELKLAFSAPESSYAPLTAAEVIERNQAAAGTGDRHLLMKPKGASPCARHFSRNEVWRSSKHLLLCFSLVGILSGTKYSP